MEIYLLKILFTVLCFQFLFVSIFLFQNKKGKTLSNKLLGIVFLMTTIAIINLYIIVFRVDIKLAQLLLIDDTFMFSYGPLLYLFTQSVLFKEYRLKKNNILHFIPFFLAICVIIVIALFIKADSIFDMKSQNIPLYIHFGELFMLAHIFYYLIKSKIEIKKVLGKTMEIYSSFNQGNFKLLKFIINSFFVLFLLSLLHSILPFAGFKNGLLITLLLMILFMFYFINSILLKMLNQSPDNSGSLTQINFKEKYAGSSLSVNELGTLKDKLWSYMGKSQCFLDSELNINHLSTELKISSKVLSQVINEGYDCNFFDFVNKFRVETAKSIFENQIDENLTIMEVMYDSGFNSKSSFNTAFKKFTKLTPTQFKNAIEKGSTS